MLQSGLRPSAVTFNSLIHMFAKAGLCNDAEELLRRMQREGVQPNTVTFNILIKMHAEAGNPWDAIRTFRYCILNLGVPLVCQWHLKCSSAAGVLLVWPAPRCWRGAPRRTAALAVAEERSSECIGVLRRQHRSGRHDVNYSRGVPQALLQLVRECPLVCGAPCLSLQGDGACRVRPRCPPAQSGGLHVWEAGKVLPKARGPGGS